MLLCCLGGCWGVAMLSGWLVGVVVVVWVVAGVLICVVEWLPGNCYVVWVVAGALLCGVGVARVLLYGLGVAGALLCGLGGWWGVAM